MIKKYGEPVAWLNEYSDGSTNITRLPNGTTSFDSLVPSKPLYTEEQLQPRVKMTKEQCDTLTRYKKNSDLLSCLEYFLEHDGVNKFGLSSENLMGFLTQEDIARAWLNPEETIEIVPDKKWFVRSKEPDDEGYYEFLENLIQLKLNWCYSKDKQKPHKTAVKFDTKEQAEEWTNPLTEAVLLPVEGE